MGQDVAACRPVIPTPGGSTRTHLSLSSSPPAPWYLYVFRAVPGATLQGWSSRLVVVRSSSIAYIEQAKGRDPCRTHVPAGPISTQPGLTTTWPPRRLRPSLPLPGSACAACAPWPWISRPQDREMKEPFHPPSRATHLAVSLLFLFVFPPSPSPPPSSHTHAHPIPSALGRFECGKQFEVEELKGNQCGGKPSEHRPRATRAPQRAFSNPARLWTQDSSSPGRKWDDWAQDFGDRAAGGLAPR